MKILITGCMGYIGPAVMARVRNTFPNATIIGLDTGYFSGQIFGSQQTLPELSLNHLIIEDIRNIKLETLRGVDAVIHLSAISNDPMGKAFQDVTRSVNYKASLNMANMAKSVGVKRFIFASSCSVYGAGGSKFKTEKSSLDPLTEYAKSKIDSEEALKKIATKDFEVLCLRFATACGWSPRLRLDLVLNDFVASAILNKKINILSDGSPLRPLIDVEDMAKAISWAIGANMENKIYDVFNVGRNDWNFSVKELAEKVSDTLKGVEVATNSEASPDNRSYKVSFDKFASHNVFDVRDISETIEKMAKNIIQSKFILQNNFRDGKFMRLVALNMLKENNMVDTNLFFKNW